MTKSELLAMAVGSEEEFGPLPFPDSHLVVRDSVDVWRFVDDWAYTEYNADELLAQAAVWNDEAKARNGNK